MKQVATLIVGAGIAGLFLLDRNRKARVSPALWLPVIWLWIAGSRSVSQWLQLQPQENINVLQEGSPLDRNVFAALLVVGILVLVGRRAVISQILRANLPFCLLVAYCAASVLWSDYPDVAFKRWTKLLGDNVMILIVLTDRERSAALRSVLARVGFVLLPLSILFIKYYPDLGRAYAAHWDGTTHYVGVAGDKNMLGMTCLVFGLGSMWRLFQEIAGSRRFKTVVVHGVIVGMAIWLLMKCDSMTSLSSFWLGSSLMAATTFLKVAQKRFVVHIMVATAIAVCVSSLFLDFGGGILSSMGRDPTLTGRTNLWNTVLRIAHDPVLGTGFESFWLGERLKAIWNIYWWHPIEAHNGYIELFVNLGWVGVILMTVVIGNGYRNVVRMLSYDQEVGRLRLAYFVVGLIYNFTEAAIHTLSVVWIFFILSTISLPKVSSLRSRIVRRHSADGIPKERFV